MLWDATNEVHPVVHFLTYLPIVPHQLLAHYLWYCVQLT